MVWNAIDWLFILKKLDQPDKIKRDFSQAVTVSILLLGCTTWTLTKRMEKKLDRNYAKMLRAVLNKSCNQQPAKEPLYGHLIPVSQTILEGRTKHVEYCCLN